jgi:hypothetical protein
MNTLLSFLRTSNYVCLMIEHQNQLCSFFVLVVSIMLQARIHSCKQWVYTSTGETTRKPRTKPKNTKLPTQPLLTTNGNNNQQINTIENIEQKRKRGSKHTPAQINPNNHTSFLQHPPHVNNRIHLPTLPPPSTIVNTCKQYSHSSFTVCSNHR